MGDIVGTDTGGGTALVVVALVAAGLAVCAGLVAALAAVRTRAAARRDLAAARAESAELRARLEAVERRTRERVEPEAHVPEPLARPEEQAAPVEVRATLPAPVFTDMVVRESVIRVASLSHGVRRALRPEQRHRVRFEVRRVTKQARKQRRSELKAALREMRATQRAAQRPRPAAEDRAGRAGEDAA